MPRTLLLAGLVLCASSTSAIADTVTAPAAGACGHVSTRLGTPPAVSQSIFDATITSIDGRSTPLQETNRERVGVGPRVLLVAERIPSHHFTASERERVLRMKRREFPSASKPLTIDVQPGMTYLVGAQLKRDQLDVDSIRDNAYWEPVVWDVRPGACS